MCFSALVCKCRAPVLILIWGRNLMMYSRAECMLKGLSHPNCCCHLHPKGFWFCLCRYNHCYISHFAYSILLGLVPGSNLHSDSDLGILPAFTCQFTAFGFVLINRCILRMTLTFNESDKCAAIYFHRAGLTCKWSPSKFDPETKAGLVKCLQTVSTTRYGTQFLQLATSNSHLTHSASSLAKHHMHVQSFFTCTSHSRSPSTGIKSAASVSRYGSGSLRIIRGSTISLSVAVVEPRAPTP